MNLYAVFVCESPPGQTRARMAKREDIFSDDVVGVILDTMRQIETFLLQRHYDGFLKKGRIRSRSANAQGGAMGDALDLRAVGKLCLAVGSIFIFGIVAWAVRHQWGR